MKKCSRSANLFFLFDTDPFAGTTWSQCSDAVPVQGGGWRTKRHRDAQGVGQSLRTTPEVPMHAPGISLKKPLRTTSQQIVCSSKSIGETGLSCERSALCFTQPSCLDRQVHLQRGGRIIQRLSVQLNEEQGKRQQTSETSEASPHALPVKGSPMWNTRVEADMRTHAKTRED